MDYSCDSCFNDQRSLNDKLIATIGKAQKYANETGQTVVIYPVPGSWEFSQKNAYGNGSYVREILPDNQ